MAEVELVTGVRENLVGLVELFVEVATTDPIAAAMMVSGLVFVAVSVTVFGVLSLGGVLSWVSDLFPSPGGPSQPAR